MTKLWHLPEDHLGKNPYGELLMLSLQGRGVHVVPIPTEPFFALRLREGRPDVAHFQFVQPYILPALQPESRWRGVVKGVLFLTQVGLLRLAGCRIVWTVHNLVNHERRLARIEWFFTLLFTRMAHDLVVQGRTAGDALIEQYRLGGSEDKITALFHPNYIGAYPDVVSRDEARRQLGVPDDTVMILALGQIRGYKGLPELVEAFRELEGPGQAALWIAGEPVDADLAKGLQKEAGEAPNIHVRDAFLDPAEVDVLVKASDVVALPYRAILTSGAAVLAMSFGRACIAPRLGCLPELLDDEGTFFYESADERGLADALARAVAARAELPAMGRHNRERIEPWDWDRAADALVRLYRAPDGEDPGDRPGQEEGS